MKKLSLFLLLLIFPLHMVNAADTLGELKQELKDLQNEKAQNDASKNKTQSQINEENQKISNANSEVEKAQNDIIIAQNKIAQSSKEIKQTEEETKKLLKFYQLIDGGDDLFNFITSSSSMTELIMRAESITQLLNYSQNRLSELENQIVENNELQVTLVKKQQELNEKISLYEESLEGLKNDLSTLIEVNLDIDAQIKAQKELIEYYEDIGCKDNELLSTCIDIANSTRWLKPTQSGYISSAFGYRSFYLNGAPYSDFHNAVDVAGNAGGTPVYAAASGTVAAVIHKASCGGNQIYIHVRVQGVAYTLTYAHLLDIKVKVGDKVTQQTVIGSVGGGGSTLKKNGGWDTCSTGYHLHFGVAKGFYLGGGAEGYSSYSKYVANSIVPPMMPGYGAWYYSRY